MVNSYQLAEADMCSHHQWLGDIEEWDHICMEEKLKGDYQHGLFSKQM